MFATTWNNKPRKLSFVFELDLADYNTATNSHDDIYVLIGSDYYWDVITGHVIQESSGLTSSQQQVWLVGLGTSTKYQEWG
jgi:uncharacterized protein CbrC (UPF0167 family)